MKQEVMVIVYLLFSLILIFGGVFTRYILPSSDMGAWITLIGFLCIATISYSDGKKK